MTISLKILRFESPISDDRIMFPRCYLTVWTYFHNWLLCGGFAAMLNSTLFILMKVETRPLNESATLIKCASLFRSSTSFAKFHTSYKRYSVGSFNTKLGVVSWLYYRSYWMRPEKFCLSVCPEKYRSGLLSVHYASSKISGIAAESLHRAFYM